MRHAAQEALYNPEFCSTLGRKEAPFYLFSSRKQEADKVWLAWDRISPQVSLQPSQKAHSGHQWTSRWLQEDSGPFFRQLSVISLIQDCALSLNHLALTASISLLSSWGREGTSERIPSLPALCRVLPLLGQALGGQSACPFPGQILEQGAFPQAGRWVCTWGSAEPWREERRRVMESQLEKEQNVPHRDLGRKANMKVQLSKA